MSQARVLSTIKRANSDSAIYRKEHKTFYREQMSAENTPQQKQVAVQQQTPSTVAANKSSMSEVKADATSGAKFGLATAGGYGFLRYLFERMTCSGFNKAVYDGCMSNKDATINNMWLQMITLVFVSMALGAAAGALDRMCSAEPHGDSNRNEDAQESEDVSENRRSFKR